MRRLFLIVGGVLSLTLPAASLSAQVEISAGDPSPQDAYLLQAGDELEITVWEHPDLSRKVLIRDDGTFPFPLLEEVPASGRSLPELEGLLQEQLTQRYNDLQKELQPPSEPPEIFPAEELDQRVVSIERIPEEVYRLRPGDELKVTVWGHGDLNQNVQIREDGAFSFPLIGNVQAVGRTLLEAEKEIQERLDRDYIVNPQVSVQLLTAEFFVMGAVSRPGTYPTGGKMDLLNAIGQAGGVTGQASDAVEIVRGEGQDRVAIRANLGEVIGGRQPNIAIMPRDAIHVKGLLRRKKSFASEDLQMTVRLIGAKFVVLGEAERPGAQSIEGPMDVLTAISIAGGLTKFGSSRIEVIRTVQGKKSVLRANLDRILAGKEPNFPIFPRDTIYVRRRLF